MEKADIQEGHSNDEKAHKEEDALGLVKKDKENVKAEGNKGNKGAFSAEDIIKEGSSYGKDNTARV